MKNMNKSRSSKFKNLRSPALATWIWDATALERDLQDMILFLQQKYVSKVYVQIDRAVSSITYGNFIESARGAEIEVYALDGGPEWVSPEGDESLSKLNTWFSNHQQSQPFPRRFAGLKLDVEPYLYKEWDEQRATIIHRYQTVLTQAKQIADSSKIPFEADLPFWFDQIHYENSYGMGTLAEWAIALCDSITLMAYRDSAGAINELAKNNIVIGMKYNKPILIGVETMKSAEGNYLSFFEEGESYMLSQLQQVNAHFRDSESFGGFAIHHFYSWKILKP